MRVLGAQRVARRTRPGRERSRPSRRRAKPHGAGRVRRIPGGRRAAFGAGASRRREPHALDCRVLSDTPVCLRRVEDRPSPPATHSDRRATGARRFAGVSLVATVSSLPGLPAVGRVAHPRALLREDRCHVAFSQPFDGDRRLRVRILFARVGRTKRAHEDHHDDHAEEAPHDEEEEEPHIALTERAFETMRLELAPVEVADFVRTTPVPARVAEFPV